MNAAILRGVDRAAFAVALAVRLRAHGVSVGATAIEDFTRALAQSPPDSRARLYWTARVTLVRSHSELAAFDAVFAAVFADAVLAMDPNARRKALISTFGSDDSFAAVAGTPQETQSGAGLPWVTLPPTVDSAEESDSPLVVPERLPTALVGLLDVPFEQLRPQDMELLGRWLASAARTWPTRRSRRLAVDRRGRRIAIRPTIARSRRTGWEPISLVRVKQVDRPRPVVMLCDVSQSMQAQASAYFHLMRALALTADAEVFAFATRLTRLTPVLTHRSAEVAIAEATAKVLDRFGGTRIASNLQALLASHHGGSVRGAIVVIGSDGWDSDTPEALAAAMAHLQRRAHRVIWMNPRAAAPGFQPRVATMAAALPYCDALLGADSFRSLSRVITEIARSSSPGSSSTGSRRSKGGTAPG
ncbi:MAG: VWA domain-containing protein [Mycobacteriaceae bacterium]